MERSDPRAHDRPRRPRAAAGLWLLAALAAAAPAAALESVLVPAGAVWRYLDDGTDPGATWRDAGFDDSAWASGPAELGYGDGDEASVVGYGPDPAQKYVTTWFRLAVEVADPGAWSTLRLRVRRDDGAVVHLNGGEVFRSSMPLGAVTAQTLALLADDDGDGFHEKEIPASFLVPGTNQLAVEIHQVSPTSSDISFDLELLASDEPFVPQAVRGPYLQLATSSSVAVRWRTDFADDSVLRYGPSPAQLDQVVSSATPTTEHEVPLSGLPADTLFYYSIGSSGGSIAGGDAEHRLRTAPVPGTRAPLRIWALGDSGTGTASARAVRDAYLALPGADETDVWLMLGDNAYNTGTDAEYQTKLFEIYPTILRRAVLWPSLGNHDAVSSSSATQTGPYFQSFTLPKLGEAGGVASGTEAYHAFDHGNVHFVCLDSAGSSRLPTGAMATWLQADLAATDQDWIVAFWHHPPYTKGSHDSDTESTLVQMRQNLLPVLEAGGVDLVLAGHSHSYERSFQLDGHYGTSGTLTAEMIVDGGDGDPAGDGAYEKPVLGPTPHQGAVYVVAGSSGQTTAGPLDHPAMVTSLLTLGSLVIDVDGSQLDARFLDSAGVVQDSFRIRKPLPGAPACSDGVDDDRDGFTDTADPGCQSANGPLENPRCQNGVHDDADGKMDFDGGLSIHGPGSPLLTDPDPQCAGKPWKDREGTGCGLGFEASLLLPLLAAWRRRRARE
jgi:hypothetical protein